MKDLNSKLCAMGNHGGVPGRVVEQFSFYLRESTLAAGKNARDGYSHR